MITAVEGYDWKNYDRDKGINPSGEDVVSNLVVEQVADLILSGYADATIKNILYETYGMNSYCVKFITAKAHKHINEFEEAQTENLMKKQTSRLLKIYRDCIDNGDNKTALSTLAEINKLHKLYATKIEITSDVFTLDLGIETSKRNEDTEQDN